MKPSEAGLLRCIVSMTAMLPEYMIWTWWFTLFMLGLVCAETELFEVAVKTISNPNAAMRSDADVRFKWFTKLVLSVGQPVYLLLP